MRKLISILLSIIVLCSCSSTKLAYFENLNNEETGTVGAVDYNIRLVPSDELLITVTSEIPEATAIYNLPITNPAMNMEIGSVTSVNSKQQTYIVDKSGDINFPVLGKIHVEGMTTFELSDYLTRKISEDVEAPYVRVELVNFKIKVLGEVLHPGSYKIDTERVSILDALAEAGDMTVYGRRDNVLLIREENGVRSYYRLNLNDSRVLESPYFYLQQNDVVYVEPGDAKKGQAEFNQNNTYKVSIISTIITGISVIASLVIALTK